jgi:hypothetical protein
MEGWVDAGKTGTRDKGQGTRESKNNGKGNRKYKSRSFDSPPPN